MEDEAAGSSLPELDKASTSDENGSLAEAHSKTKDSFSSVVGEVNGTSGSPSEVLVKSVKSEVMDIGYIGLEGNNDLESNVKVPVIQLERCPASEEEIAAAIEAAEIADARPFVCYVCYEYQTDKIYRLLAHDRTCHNGNISAEKAKAIAPGCPKCGKKYSQVSHLAAHIKKDKHDYDQLRINSTADVTMSLKDVGSAGLRMPEEDDSVAETKPPRQEDCSNASEPLRYQCYHCPKLYWSVAGLRKHIKVIHKRKLVKEKIKSFGTGGIELQSSLSQVTQQLEVQTHHKVKAETPQEVDSNSLVYVCVKCKRHFLAKKAATMHYRSRHSNDVARKQWFHLKQCSDVPVVKATCRLCSVEFKSWKALYQHQKKVHRNLSQGISQKAFFARHVQRSKSCHVCKKKFENLSQLSRHKRIVHRTSHQSSACRTKHKSSARCTKTINLWSLCHLCGMTVPTTQISRHMSQNHLTTADVIPIKPLPANEVKNGPHQCLYCSAEFRSRALFSRHIRRKHMEITRTANSKPVNCPECDLLFLNQMQLDNHRKTVHKPIAMPSKDSSLSSSGSDLVFPCSKCGQVLSSLSSLEKHMRHLHCLKNIDGVVIEGVPRDTASDAQPLCRICGIQFERWALLYKHLRKQECGETTSQSSPTKWFCVQCMSPFRNQQRFLQHKRVCRGPKRCSELVSQAPQALLLEHYASAHNSAAKSCDDADTKIDEVVTSAPLDKPLTKPGQPLTKDGTASQKLSTIFSCKLCDMSYHTRSGLRKHSKMHTVGRETLLPDVGEKSAVPTVTDYSCQFCTYSSTDLTTLKEHYVAVHKLSKTVVDNQIKQQLQNEVLLPGSANNAESSRLPVLPHSQTWDSSSSDSSNWDGNVWYDTDSDSASSSSDTSSSDDSDEFCSKEPVSTSRTLVWSSSNSSSSSDESGTDVELPTVKDGIMNDDNDSSKSDSMSTSQSNLVEMPAVDSSTNQDELITSEILELDKRIFHAISSDKRSFDAEKRSMNSDEASTVGKFDSTISHSSKSPMEIDAVSVISKTHSCLTTSTDIGANNANISPASSQERDHSADTPLSMKSMESQGDKRTVSCESVSLLKETSRPPLPNLPEQIHKSSLIGSMERLGSASNQKFEPSKNHRMPIMSCTSSNHSENITSLVTKATNTDQLTGSIVSPGYNNSAGIFNDSNPTSTLLKRPPVAILRPFSGVPEGDNTPSPASSSYGNSSSTVALPSHVGVHGFAEKRQIRVAKPLYPLPQIDASASKSSYPIYCVNSTDYIVPFTFQGKDWYRRMSVVTKGSSFVSYPSQWYKDFTKCTWKVVALLAKPLESEKRLQVVMNWILEHVVLEHSSSENLLQINSFCGDNIESIVLLTSYKTTKHSSLCCLCGLLVNNFDELNAHGSTGHPMCSKCYQLKESTNLHVCNTSPKDLSGVQPKVKFIPLAHTCSSDSTPFAFSSGDIFVPSRHVRKQRTYQQQRKQSPTSTVPSKEKTVLQSHTPALEDLQKLATAIDLNGEGKCTNNTIPQPEVTDLTTCKSLQRKEDKQAECKQREFLQDTQPYKCSWCDIEFLLEIQLQHHLRAMHKKCMFCSEIFKDRQERSDHITQKHRKYICLACDYTSEEIGNIQEHVLKDHVDAETGLFKCIRCENKRVRPEAIIDHLREDDLELSQKCHLCDSKLPLLKEDRFQHFCGHALYSVKVCCIPCDRLFMEPWALRKHLLTANHNYCAKCLLTSISELDGHLCSDSGFEIHPSVTQEAAHKTQRSARLCKLCFKDMDGMSLKEHCDEQHSEYHLQCDQCGQRFEFDHQRSFHMQLHKRRNWHHIVCSNCLRVHSVNKKKTDQTKLDVVSSCLLCRSGLSSEDQLREVHKGIRNDKPTTMNKKQTADKPKAIDKQNVQSSSSAGTQNGEDLLRVPVLVEDIDSPELDSDEMKLMLDGRLYKFASDDENDASSPANDELDSPAQKSPRVEIDEKCSIFDDSDNNPLVIDEMYSPKRATAVHQTPSPTTKDLSLLSCHLCSFTCKLQVALNRHLAKKHHL